MRVSGRRLWAEVGAIASLIGLVVTLSAAAAVNGVSTNKVIIYPTAQDSIADLKAEGITNVRNYGSYWLAEATDSQVETLKQRHGSRAVRANYLNRIELSTATIDTTSGEPKIPAALRFHPSGGKDLQLVQFVGPVRPEWLKQIRDAGDARIVSYVPQNAYVVSMDAAAEKKIESLKAPNGPVQWVGPYHPYYKFNPALSQGTNTTLKVRVAIVDDSEAESTIGALEQFNLGKQPQVARGSGQQVVGLVVHPEDLANIAQLPNVLWIVPVWPTKTMDERADLLEASRTNQLPGHAPVPGFDNYMDFLTNQVGFSTTPEEYPVVDLADTIFPSYGSADFSVLGNPANESRDVGYMTLCNPSATYCDIHADWTTSTAVGANISETASNQDSAGFRLGLGVSPFGRFANTVIFTLQGSACTTCEGDFSPSGDWHDLPLNQYVVHRARISNNSWGDVPVVGGGGNAGEYDDLSRTFDDCVRDASLAGQLTNGQVGIELNQEMVIVCSAGNYGAYDIGSGGLVDEIVTPPATAKNVIAAGATENVRPAAETTGPCSILAPLTIGDADNSYAMAYFSSFGPTIDGRMKPEIVAPGTAIFALSEELADGEVISNAYGCVSGTSFAAPAVSGGIQLMWWYFQNRLQDEQGSFLLQPSPAMAKAYLCNAARYLPIANPQHPTAMDTLPSIAQGMGMMDLARMFDGVPRVIRDESTPRAIDTGLLTTNPVPQQTYFSRSGQSYEVDGQIFDPTLPFRVTVAWTDPPGNPGVLQQLVNDLDLQVTIGGQTYLGNRFSGQYSVPNTDSSVVGAGTPDSINNMESVFLPPGQTGTWSVVVRATDIAGNAVSNVPNSVVGQDFALVIYNAATANRSDAPTTNNVNDSCQAALQLAGPFPFSFTNMLSKGVYHKTIPSPSAGIGGVQEFFKIVNPSPPTPGTVFTVNTIGSGFDAVLSVWQAEALQQVVPARTECGDLQELVSDNNGANSSVSFTADGSNDYYIVVEPHNNGSGGMLVLNVNTSASLITLTPTSLAFADQVEGTVSAPMSVTYQNGNQIPVTVNTATITGADPADFTIVSGNCIGNQIQPGTNCTVTVAFAPQATGPRQANLEIFDTATGSPRIVPLSGNGTPPVPLICLGSSGQIQFPSTAVGLTSAVQNIVITNCGTEALIISNVFLLGAETNDFLVVPGCALRTPIAPGGNCSIAVEFTPTTRGLRQATLDVSHNASTVPITIALQGTGFVPTPAICVASAVNFSSVAAGATGVVQSLIITNCGTAPLVISNLTLTAGNTAEFLIDASTTCGSNPIQTGQTCAVNLRFAPTAGGQRSATLTIVSSNNVPEPQTVTLTGLGALSRPDVGIGKTFNNLKKFIGLGVINTTGVGQELSQNVHRGAKGGIKYYVTIENVGTAADSFTVQSTQIKGGAGWAVNYYLGARPSESVDVTRSALAGTFSTATMEAGAITSDTTMIRAELFANKTLVSKGTTATFALTFTSANDPTQQDTVWITGVAK
ncbi:MAG TPA: choice-of-anchor D domain-containing protein [Verrucomicrobiae bacterium]|nr:choice-of-anchor D domain-containing protein [Verrucomicrobiae bacterium]